MNHVRFLHQTDFENGTFRIVSPGIYKLAENIIFNPQKSPSDNPNMYPSSVYRTGFFAAITVECPDVIIDGCGFSLSQGYQHYVKQRFFSCIECASQPFISNQGPAPTSMQPKCANRCLICNINFKLSSHHSIHGNDNKLIIIKNVTCSEFEVCAIQFNNPNRVCFQNVSIFDAISRVEMNPLFTQTFFLLDVLNNVTTTQFREQNGITIAGVHKTGKELYDTLHDAFSIAEQKLLNSENLSKNSIFFNDNPGGGHESLPDGNQYGIVINKKGIVVGSLPDLKSLSTMNERAQNIVYSNVKIEGIHSAFKEYIGIMKEDENGINKGPIGAVFSYRPDENGKYKPHAYYDLVAWASQYTDACNLDQNVMQWISGTLSDEVFKNKLVYNIDSMAHTSKGNEGVLNVGVHNLLMENVQVRNIKNFTVIEKASHPDKKNFFGSTCIGLMNYLPTGTIDLKNIQIDDIVSTNGTSIGMEYTLMKNTKPKLCKVSIHKVKGKTVTMLFSYNHMITAGVVKRNFYGS
jgi:hypothetical protein